MNGAAEDILPLSALGLAALTYAVEFGWPVFPLHSMRNGRCSCGDGECARAAKHPRIPNGFHGASSHPEQIDRWWTQWPNANIGFSPGTFDLLVLDIDGDDGERIARDAGAFDVDTLEVITSRGVHRYYQLPTGVIVGNSAHKQLDVRSAAGYVLLPPSVHSSGHVYQWRGAIE